jgi:phosphopantetheine--protein transferase-like protein
LERVGNDIVDLKVAATESNWERKGFLNKIFTAREREYISNSNNKFNTVWRLWSMKESAYKLYIQQNGERFFNPKKLECTIFSKNEGQVIVGESWFSTSTKSNNNLIFSTALIDKSTTVISCDFKINNCAQSEQTHSAILHYIAFLTKFKLSKLTIKKSANNVPCLYFQNEQLPWSISLSHHGTFGAFSLIKN